MAASNIELNPQSTGLVIVDMQVEGCERHGPGVKPVIANIRRLLDRFRAVNGKIIHVQSVRTKDHPEFTVFGRPYGLLLGSPGADFVEALRPIAGEEVVQKPRTIVFTRRPWKRSWRNYSSGPAEIGSSSPVSGRATASIMRSLVFTSGIITASCPKTAFMAFILSHSPSRCTSFVPMLTTSM
jgi:Isochorismatase family